MTEEDVVVGIKNLIASHQSTAAIPFWDIPAEGTPLPYITLDSITTTPADADDCPRPEHTVTLSYWEAASTRINTIRVAAHLRDALHRQDITTSTERSVLYYLSTNTLPDPQKGIQRAVIRLRSVLQ